MPFHCRIIRFLLEFNTSGTIWYQIFIFPTELVQKRKTKSHETFSTFWMTRSSALITTETDVFDWQHCLYVMSEVITCSNTLSDGFTASLNSRKYNQYIALVPVTRTRSFPRSRPKIAEYIKHLRWTRCTCQSDRCVINYSYTTATWILIKKNKCVRCCSVRRAEGADCNYVSGVGFFPGANMNGRKEAKCLTALMHH